MYTIMAVDDDESIGNMEQELLEREGYQVQRAFSGTEALLLLKEYVESVWGIGFRWKLGFDGENANE